MANRIASQIKQLKSRGYYDLLLKAVAPELALKYDKLVMQCSRLQVSDRFAFLCPIGRFRARRRTIWPN